MKTYFNHFLVIFTLLLSNISICQIKNKTEIKRLQKLASQVTIIRDKWGIAHVYGTTDADAVFGMLYAQCEDDFKRVEQNYIEKLGRLSEIKGKSFLYNDLEIRLLIDANDAQADYKKAAPWLKKLLNSYADGINFYLHNHPEVKPKLLTHFEPWYPLLWNDGSIGAISTADLSTAELQLFYDVKPDKTAYTLREKDNQTGSNGFAISGSKTESRNAILYINPHTTFYFRPEIQISSTEGLQAYGAVTWGQFFIYQGFNENCGWMHTSSNVDVADLYQEKITSKNGKYFYEYDGKTIPVKEKQIEIKYLQNNKLISRSFTTYSTIHGPIMASRNGKWLSLKSNNRSMNSLIQSWKRTKATGFEDYKKVMDLKANTSNNTIFADNKDNIAYWHGNYIPKRDTKLNWALPVDGSTSSTQWNGLHDVSETVHIYNPPSGWLQNCNSTPFSVAGIDSPKKQNYVPYMAPDGESFRGINAVRLLSAGKKYTLDKIITDGYDTKLSIFEQLIPALVKCFDANKTTNNFAYSNLEAPISVLKNWNYYADKNSIATTLANEWAYKLDPILQKTYIDQGELDQIENTQNFIKNATAEQLLPQLAIVINELTSKFGTWQIPWGELNRFQRITDAIDLKYDDNLPSFGINQTTQLWGCLPAFKSNYFNTKKRYGTTGNSFVCAVEFGKKVRAKSLLAGGNSGDKSSKHFDDQTIMYQNNQFKDVLFYKEDVRKNAEKTYHPGE